MSQNPSHAMAIATGLIPEKGMVRLNPEKVQGKVVCSLCNSRDDGVRLCVMSNNFNRALKNHPHRYFIFQGEKIEDRKA